MVGCGRASWDWTCDLLLTESQAGVDGSPWASRGASRPGHAVSAISSHLLPPPPAVGPVFQFSENACLCLMLFVLPKSPVLATTGEVALPPWGLGFLARGATRRGGPKVGGLSEGCRQRAPQPLNRLGGLRTFFFDTELGSALGGFLIPKPSAHLPEPCCEYSESGTETPSTSEVLECVEV